MNYRLSKISALVKKKVFWPPNQVYSTRELLDRSPDNWTDGRTEFPWTIEKRWIAIVQQENHDQLYRYIEIIIISRVVTLQRYIYIYIYIWSPRIPIFFVVVVKAYTLSMIMHASMEHSRNVYDDSVHISYVENHHHHHHDHHHAIYVYLSRAPFEIQNAP